MFSTSLKYINLREDTKKIKVDQETFVNKVNECASLGFIRIEYTTKFVEITTALFKNNKTIYMIKTNKCENIKRVNAYDDLYIIDEKLNVTWYCTNAIDDKKNKQVSGTKCTRYVQDRFKERTGHTFKEAFGSSDPELKMCVPKSFYYINESLKDKTLEHVSAIDYCSQYPSMLCGRLPTTKDCLKVEGQLDPTPEYPFAFYIKSGHCAEYNVFDTRDWQYSSFRNSLLGIKDNEWNGDYNLPASQDITILMKASEYTLSEEMQHYYAKRKRDPFAKQVMVSLIGCFHMDYYKSWRLGHIAAVVIARANNRMNAMAEHMIADGNSIVHICVDGCIYKGTKEYGVKIKDLKNCYQEFTDCTFKMRGMNSYVAMKNDRVEKFKHGAYDKREDGLDIETVCNGLDDIYLWYKDYTELQKIEDWSGDYE